MSSYSRDRIKSEIDRMCAHGLLTRDSRPYTLLNYLIDKTLNGKADQLDAYTIALEVFNRPEGFDANTNSLVRVEMYRLRRALNEYASFPPRNVEIKITIPTNGYVVNFEQVLEDSSPDEQPLEKQEQDDQEPISNRNRKVLTGAALSFAFLGLTMPVINEISDLGHLTGDCTQTNPGVMLDYDSNSPWVRAIAQNLEYDIQQYQNVELRRDKPKPCDKAPVFDLSISSKGTNSSVIAELRRADENQTLWANIYEIDPEAPLDPQRQIAAWIANDSAGKSTGISLLARNTPWPNSDYHFCLHRAANLFTGAMPDDDDLNEVQSCLRKYAFEENSAAHASMLAAVHFRISRKSNNMPPLEQYDEVEMMQAYELAGRLNPLDKDYLLVSMRMLQQDKSSPRARKVIRAQQIESVIERKFPTHPVLQSNLAVLQVWPLDKPDEALETARYASRMSAGGGGFVWGQTYALLAKGDWQALEEFSPYFFPNDAWPWVLVRMKLLGENNIPAQERKTMQDALARQGITSREDVRRQSLKLGFGVQMRDSLDRLATEFLPSENDLKVTSARSIYSQNFPIYP